MLYVGQVGSIDGSSTGNELDKTESRDRFAHREVSPSSGSYCPYRSNVHFVYASSTGRLVISFISGR